MITEMEADAAASFDWTAFDSASTAVVTAVAEASGRDPLAITPLYDVIDPEALEEVFTRTGYSTAPTNAWVQFEYEGYRVVVKANGRGYLYE